MAFRERLRDGTTKITGADPGLTTIVCTSTTNPANPRPGQIVYETDTAVMKVWDAVNSSYFRLNGYHKHVQNIGAGGNTTVLAGWPTGLNAGGGLILGSFQKIAGPSKIHIRGRTSAYAAVVNTMFELQVRLYTMPAGTIYGTYVLSKNGINNASMHMGWTGETGVICPAGVYNLQLLVNVTAGQLVCDVNDSHDLTAEEIRLY